MSICRRWLLVGCAVLSSNLALAQQDVARRIPLDAYYFYEGQTYDAHAYDWARFLNQFSATRELVPIDAVQEVVKAIRRNVEAAQKAYSKLSDATKKNPQSARKLAQIEKEHTRILDLCTTLDPRKDTSAAESETICAHCQEIERHLTAVHSASREAAAAAGVSTDELERELAKPGRGRFSS